MNNKEFIKKYWFVALIGIVLVAFIGVYAADAYKNRELTVNSKVVDDKYAVYSVDGEYVFADDFFDSLYTQNGTSCALNMFINKVVDAAYETTDEIKDQAATMAYNLYSYYGMESLEELLVNNGYTNGVDDLTDFCITYLKQMELVKEYALANWDEMFANYDSETENPRMVYHILIKVADVTSSTDEDGNAIYTPNPTEDEQAKIDAVLADLAAGKDFLEVQAEYNEDTNNDPYFVNVSNDSSLQATFLDASLELEDGATSDLVATSYGYHIIKNYGTDKQLLCDNSTFISQLYSANSNATIKAIMAKADELDYKLVDEELLEYVNAQLGSEDGE